MGPGWAGAGPCWSICLCLSVSMAARPLFKTVALAVTGMALWPEVVIAWVWAYESSDIMELPPIGCETKQIL